MIFVIGVFAVMAFSNMFSTRNALEHLVIQEELIADFRSIRQSMKTGKQQSGGDCTDNDVRRYGLMIEENSYTTFAECGAENSYQFDNTDSLIREYNLPEGYNFKAFAENRPMMNPSFVFFDSPELNFTVSEGDRGRIINVNDEKYIRISLSYNGNSKNTYILLNTGLITNEEYFEQ